jgi:hypothetical protein
MTEATSARYTDMKAKIWVLCTVLADENAPAMPAVLAVEPVAETTEGTPVGPARFWRKGRTFPFYGVYITLDETAKR